MRHGICVRAALGLLLALPVHADIYRWTDAEGRLHFTQDLSQVPPEQRRAARERAASPEGPTRYQRIGRGAGEPARSAPPASPGSGTVARETFRIAVQRAGAQLLVQARLNGSVTAPFLIDTGASDVVIPQSVANDLGLRVGPETRTMLYHTANGVVEQPVVMLRSVELGGARANDVPATISAGMTMGLLGLSFFNHFTYQIDAAAGVVTLTPNQLASSGAIRGGRSEAQWRASYRNLHGRMALIEAERDRTPGSRSRKLRHLAEALADLERQRAGLEGEADAARVPMSWRE